MANKTLKLTCAFCEVQLKPLEMGICRSCKEKNRHLRSWRRQSWPVNAICVGLIYRLTRLWKILCRLLLN